MTLAICIAAVFGLATATTASAYGTQQFYLNGPNNAGVYLDSFLNESTAKTSNDLHIGDNFSGKCWQYGSTVGGNSSDQWILATSENYATSGYSSNNVGWVYAGFATNGYVGNLSQCSGPIPRGSTGNAIGMYTQPTSSSAKVAPNHAWNDEVELDCWTNGQAVVSGHSIWFLTTVSWYGSTPREYAAWVYGQYVNYSNTSGIPQC